MAPYSRLAFRSLLPLVLIGVSLTAALAAPRPRLTFADRVRAQEAIERVFYAHQIGAREPFEQAVPKAVLEEKVRTYLHQSVALERGWHAPITAELLDGELQRIANSTRLPERLAEIYRALGNDPVVVRECYVRPILADRLTRAFLASDPQAGRRSWDEWWRQSGRGLEAFEPLIPDTLATTLPSPSAEKVGRPFDPAQCDPGGVWAAGPAAETPKARAYHVAVWTGSIMLVWGGQENSGVRYDPTTDLWAPISGVNAPVFDLETGAATAVWTGSRMLVWGLAVGSPVGIGGRYDPVQDAWTPISNAGAPENRFDHRVVWTGSEMIVWGGARRTDGLEINTGGRYNPSLDTWRPVTGLDAPGPREVYTAVWTGSEMIVWGGRADNNGQPALDSGGRYDPVTDSWTATSLVDAPTARAFHSAVWTGQEMLVWGGEDISANKTNTGARYDPALDQWTPMSTTGAPPARTDHVEVWTGSRLVIWGGSGETTTLFNSGGAYNPANDTWTTLPPVPTEARRGTTAVWTGTRMIIWGGFGADVFNTGGRYDPIGGTWNPTSIAGAPASRTGHSAIWTGNALIVWGGRGDSEYFADGGRYDPLSDAWTPTSAVNAPTARVGHTAVWTGNRMIVWGGESPTTPRYKKTGALYNPILNTWQPTFVNTAPVERTRHTAVWAGNRMVIMGGANFDGLVFGGARYDPATDTWSPVSSVNMPNGLVGHSAISTGATMIVWGGSNISGYLNTGTRYDPAQDVWTPISAVNAPIARADHAAVWTGDRMLVWGGQGGSPGLPALNSGGRYDPVTNAWTPMTSLNAPSPRSFAAAVWTGDRMVIWGGADPNNAHPPLATGGQYFPATDTWTATTQAGAPPEHNGHTQVWTGKSVLGWGGFTDITFYNAGYEYFPGGLQDQDADGWVCAADCDDTLNVVHPGAFELCDGLDNDCDGTVDEPDSDADGTGDCADNCVAVANPGQEDDDGDGAGNVCDCAPNDSGASAAPVQQSLFFSNDQKTLVWPAIGSATIRSVVRGKIEELPVGAGPSEICLLSDDTSASVSDPDVPALRRAFWYLMRAQNACGAASYGQTSNGTPRVTPACP